MGLPSSSSKSVEKFVCTKPSVSTNDYIDVMGRLYTVTGLQGKGGGGLAPITLVNSYQLPITKVEENAENFRIFFD